MSHFCFACLELLAKTIRAVGEDGVPWVHVVNLSSASNAMARVLWRLEPLNASVEAWMLPNGLLSASERLESTVALMVCPFVRSVRETASKTIVTISLTDATSEAARNWADQVLEDLSMEGELCGW
jgi:hypothetical protein